MIWSDPLVEEVRCARDAYAARFNYDLRAIVRDLKEQEKQGGRKLVSYARERNGVEPKQTLRQTSHANAGFSDSDATPA